MNATVHPTAEWTARQIVQAFPYDSAPKVLMRDRGSIYGERFRRCMEHLGITEVLSAPRCPKMNAFAERVIGTIRRECTDHVIVLGENHLRSILRSYQSYYNQSRTHLALAKDAPSRRPVEPPEAGRVVALPQVGGLRHRYTRRAACARGPSETAGRHLPLDGAERERAPSARALVSLFVRTRISGIGRDGLRRGCLCDHARNAPWKQWIVAGELGDSSFERRARLLANHKQWSVTGEVGNSSFVRRNRLLTNDSDGLRRTHGRNASREQWIVTGDVGNSASRDAIDFDHQQD